MKRALIALAVTGLFAGSMPASADETLFKSKGCVKCHDAEKKKKGPAIAALTAKYKGDQAAVGKLMTTVKGKDHPEVDATDAELKKLIGYAIGAK